ncbi:MAG: DUF2147 domain-containing protein [Hyphomicrobiaceae bacterium]
MLTASLPHARLFQLRTMGRIVALLVALAGSLPASAQQPPPRAAPVPAPGAAPAPAPAVPPGPTGLWIDHTGRGVIEIAACGPKLCGRIVWMKQPNDAQGRPLRDGLNPDKAQRVRAVCGLQVIGGLERQRDGSWDNGWIYDPEQGESFDVEIRLQGPDRLQVKGYKGLKFLNETFQWTRAVVPPQPLCPAA